MQEWTKQSIRNIQFETYHQMKQEKKENNKKTTTLMAKFYCTTKNTSTSKGHPDSLRPKIQQFHTFKYLMFHYIINNLTQRGKVKNNKNLNYPQRKIVQEHRNKTTKVISHSSDKDHISGGKRTKGKPVGFKPP